MFNGPALAKRLVGTPQFPRINYLDSLLVFLDLLIFFTGKPALLDRIGYARYGMAESSKRSDEFCLVSIEYAWSTRSRRGDKQILSVLMRKGIIDEVDRAPLIPDTVYCPTAIAFGRNLYIVILPTSPSSASISPYQRAGREAQQVQVF